MNRGVLVIGYGNVLRSDDGVGWHVTERLASDARFASVTVLQRHQLTPELALDLELQARFGESAVVGGRQTQGLA